MGKIDDFCEEKKKFYNQNQIKLFTWSPYFLYLAKISSCSFGSSLQPGMPAWMALIICRLIANARLVFRSAVFVYGMKNDWKIND